MILNEKLTRYISEMVQDIYAYTLRLKKRQWPSTL